MSEWNLDDRLARLKLGNRIANKRSEGLELDTREKIWDALILASLAVHDTVSRIEEDGELADFPQTKAKRLKRQQQLRDTINELMEDVFNAEKITIEG